MGGEMIDERGRFKAFVRPGIFDGTKGGTLHCSNCSSFISFMIAACSFIAPLLLWVFCANQGKMATRLTVQTV